MENKHYYRVDANGIVVYGFSDAFEQPLEKDVLVESGGRHFNPTITNERGQFILKVADREIVERTTEELDTEWSALSSEKTPEQLRIEELEAQLQMILQTLGVG